MDQKHQQFINEQVLAMKVAINDEVIEEERQDTGSDSTEAQSNSNVSADHVLTSDEAIDLCGGFGRYQILSILVLFTAMKSAGFLLQAFAFLEARPTYQCFMDNSWTSCDSSIFCNDPTVQWRVNWDDEESFDNLIMHYNLVCEPDYKIGFIGSSFLIGISIGCCTLTRAGDTYGRKPIFILGLIIQMVASIMTIFITDINISYIAYFLWGLSITAKLYVGFNYLVEIQPRNNQVIVGSMEPILQAVVYLMVCGYFYFISKNWIWLNIPTIGLALLGGIFIFFLPESPRFLVSKGKFDDARIVFNKIAKVNGKGDNFAQYFIFKDEVDTKQSQDPYGEGKVKLIGNKNKKEDQRLIELWRNKVIRRNLGFSLFIWCVNIFNYYLMVFYFKYFPGSIFTNTIIFAMADIFSYLISALIVKRISTRAALVIAFLCQIIGAAFYIGIHQYEQIIPIIIITCRIGIGMSNNTVYVGHNRLFPTQFASTTFGLLNFISHLVGIAAPQIAELDDPYPFLVCLGSGAIALFCSLFLLEKYHKDNREVFNEQNQQEIANNKI